MERDAKKQWSTPVLQQMGMDHTEQQEFAPDSDGELGALRV